MCQRVRQEVPRLSIHLIRCLVSRPLFFASISVSVTPLTSGYLCKSTSARLFCSVLSSASTLTSPTVSPKLIIHNRFLRVDKRIQKRFDFLFALFVTNCLGVHLLVACYAVSRSVPRPLHRSLCCFFSRAALVLAFPPEYRAVIFLHIASLLPTVMAFTCGSRSAGMSTSLLTSLSCSVPLNLLAFNCRIVLAGLWTNALAFTSLMSHQRSRPSPLQLSASVFTGASVST